MAQYSDLDPTRCRPSISDGTNLKPSLTTSGYSGGTPAAATDLKRSIVYPDGTLKQSIADATDLKRCMLKPGAERSQYLGSGIQDNNIAKHIRGENGNGKAPVDDGYYLDTATAAGGLKVTTLQQKFGTGSLDFDGTDDELTFSGTTALESTSSDCTTWECWIRPTTVTGNDGIFMMQDGTDYIELFREGTAITVQAYISLSEVVYITGGTITINQWHHVRVRRNATFFKLFVNGIEIGTDTDSNTFGGNSWTLTVGNGFTSGFWQGQIDEFLILDQICLGSGKPTAALAPATTFSYDDTTDMAAWYKFEEGTGTVVGDSSGNGYDGSTSGNMTWVSGKVGSYAGNFVDASADSVALSPGDFASLTQGTVCGWFKGSSTSNALLDFYGTGRLQLYVGTYTGTWSDESFTIGCMVSGTWTILAAYRQGHSFLLDDAWHHFAYTSTPNKLYIDGVQVTLSYNTGSTSTNFFFNNVTSASVCDIHAFLGTDQTGQLTVDDYRIYDRVLNATEILALYNENA
jgi:hypothetical protein